MTAATRSHAPAGPTPWPAMTDRLAQLGLAVAVGVVLAAMTVNRLQVGASNGPVLGGEPGFTWTLDALAVLGLGAAGIAHSLVRRGRPGRWSVGLLVLLLPAILLGMPGLVG